MSAKRDRAKNALIAGLAAAAAVVVVDAAATVAAVVAVAVAAAVVTAAVAAAVDVANFRVNNNTAFMRRVSCLGAPHFLKRPVVNE